MYLFVPTKRQVSKERISKINMISTSSTLKKLFKVSPSQFEPLLLKYAFNTNSTLAYPTTKVCGRRRVHFKTHVM